MQLPLARLDYIDGLRAIAILSVVGFHVGLPGFSGGFTGVDVFFVLSGFLIIGQIWTDLESRSFSLWDFYGRRALRILPPYLIVLAACAAVGSGVLTGVEELKAFGVELKASATMTINHLFLRQQGYFDSSADLKPLLNMWSLAVEEQFYLFIPAALGLLGWAMAKGWSSIAWTIVAVLTAASLAGAVLLSAGEKNYAFYLTPFRAWEFAAGGAVWILRPALERRSYLIADGLGASGLALLLGSLLFLTEALSYPSWLALFPVVGTTAVILSCGARPDAWLARGLSLRPLCFIGLISYSWYLWHWPLLSFGRISRMGARDLASDLGMAGLAAILAVATWFLVEKPIRAHRAAILRLFKPRIVVAASMSLCAVLFAVALVFLNVLAARGPTIMELDQAALEATLKGDVCAVRPERPLTGKCLQELSSGRWGILMGDSFARTSYPHLAELAKRNHIRLVTIYQIGCRPVFGTLEVKPDERCKSIFEVTIAKLAALHSRPEFVVLRSHWHAKSHALGGQNDGEEAALLQKALHSTLERLTVIGAPRVLIVGTHPNRQNQPSCLSRVLRQGLPPSRCERAAKDVAEQEAVYVSALAAAARAVPGTTVIHPSTVFCEAQTCLFTLDGQPAYTDDKHLTQAAEGLLFRSFAEEFRWVIEGRARGEAVIVLRTASSPVTSPPSIRSRPLPRGSSEADWARINWWVCRGQNPVLHERGLAARHEPAAPWGAPSHRVPGR